MERMSIFILLAFVFNSFVPAISQPILKTTSLYKESYSDDLLNETQSNHQADGDTFVVKSNKDDGPDSLRQALLHARHGDKIIFDIEVFPPIKPNTIYLLSGLPELNQGKITLDASNAGVILDGSKADGEWLAAFDILSDQNTIMGFEIAHFSGPGFLLREEARLNSIGGDRKIGEGPFGQGNLIRDTSDGIGLRGSKNIITGNLIGTDKTGKEKLGNRNPGIFIEESASGNTIGPDNIIAYNGQDSGGGVEIRSLDAQGNHITRNNIFDNASPAIYYNLAETKPASIPQPPVIFDFDLQKGVARGLACSKCTVELYTSGEAGAIFEGSIQANVDGVFDFEKGTAFSGVLLKATSYSDDQNNSEFSTPTRTTVRNLALQKDNPALRQRIQLEKDFAKVSFNHIGTMQYIGCENGQSPNDYAARAVQMGYKWMRVSIDWYDWPEIVQTGEYSDKIISTCQDEAINQIAQSGIEMLYTIVYWDPQIKVTNGYSRFRTQEEIDHYLDYVRFIVEHFKGKIHWYSILNEPNLSDGQRAVKVVDYINLLRQVIPVIKGIDPEAKVVVGEVTPLMQEGSLAYLKTIIASDVLPQADGIAWHNSEGHSLDFLPDFYRKYPSWLDDIVKSAKESGFRGEFFSTELQWRTTNTRAPFIDRGWYYSDTVAGKYFDRGMTYNLSKGFWITVGHENYESIPDVVQVISSLTRLLAGAVPDEISVNFSNPSPDLRSVGFKLADDSRLIGVWRDVKGSDTDPGVQEDITVLKIKAQKVTGIDPLFAYQQQLVTQQQGDLVIPEFLVYDYPTFIHLEGIE